MKSLSNTAQAVVQEILSECQVSEKELLHAIENYQSSNLTKAGGKRHGI